MTSASQTKARFSTVIPFSLGSTERRKLCDRPQLFAKRFAGKIIIGMVGVVSALLILDVTFDETGQQDGQGYLTQYDASITVEEAFDNRFRNCKWSTERKNGSDYVIFRGYDPEMFLDWVVTFTVYDDLFEVSQIEVDGTDVTSDIEMYYLLSYIYTGNLDELMSDMFLAALFWRNRSIIRIVDKMKR